MSKIKYIIRTSGSPTVWIFENLLIYINICMHLNQYARSPFRFWWWLYSAILPNRFILDRYINKYTRRTLRITFVLLHTFTVCALCSSVRSLGWFVHSPNFPFILFIRMWRLLSPLVTLYRYSHFKTKCRLYVLMFTYAQLVNCRNVIFRINSNAAYQPIAHTPNPIQSQFLFLSLTHSHTHTNKNNFWNKCQIFFALSLIRFISYLPNCDMIFITYIHNIRTYIYRTRANRMKQLSKAARPTISCSDTAIAYCMILLNEA